MKLYNTLLLSEESIQKIKNEYDGKLKLVTSDIRHHRGYHETNPATWVYKLVNNLIKQNMGSEYSVYTRVTILKYIEGDFFLNHIDGSHNTNLDPNLSEHFYGGIEMSERSNFIGGEFFVSGEVVPFKTGRIVTHEFDEPHGVTKLLSGVRWSIHFPIKLGYKKSIL